MAIPDEIKAELKSLLASARAHLEVEEELGGAGIGWTAPAATAAPPARPAATRPSAASTAVTHRPAPPLRQPTPGLSPEVRGARLQVLADEASLCTVCALHETRTKSVFARGTHSASLVFVGEAPGHEEDLEGLPFVGAAGQLLDKMIVAMGFGRDQVYVCNVVKCRPPGDRAPHVDESRACQKFLLPQLEVVAPQVIVALGHSAALALGVAEGSGAWRGQWSAWQGIPVMATYHPAYVLRAPASKREVWDDLKLVMQRLGKTPPKHV
jgi:DNA polymerase